jgi:heme exporter protein C
MDHAISSPAARPSRTPLPLLGLGVVTAVTFAVALYLALIYAPEEGLQGAPQRIFYLHVPLIWTGFLSFFAVFVASLGYLIRRKDTWDITARSAAEIGTVFLAAGVLVGPIWARPIWGIWWPWDARGTTTLLLFLIFIAYMMLRSTGGQSPRIARFAAVLGIIGFLNVPLVYYSVELWRTNHPGLVDFQGGGLEPEMLLAFLVALLAFTLLWAMFLIVRIRWDRAKDRVDRLRAELSQ